MGYKTTKSVRLNPSDAATLARLVQLTGSSESELFRQGLHLLDERVRREGAIERLKELASIRGPEKETYAFR